MAANNTEIVQQKNWAHICTYLYSYIHIYEEREDDIENGSKE